MRVGSLCTGYGGLDLAIGGELVWLSEFDKHAAKVCAARFPNAPNIGDLTKVDWASLAPVDVLTAGFPCQPFSHAGKRKGTEDERHIWPHIATGIRALRPGHVILENVPGLLSAGMGVVLGDLAEAGYDAQWTSIRASDVGAPHRRERVFIVASVRHPEHDERGAELGIESALTGGRSGESGQSVATDAIGGGRDGRAHDPGRGSLGRVTASWRGSTAPADAAGNGRDEGRAESAGQQGRPHAAVGGGTPADSEGDEQREQAVNRPIRREPGHGTRDRADFGQYQPAIDRWASVLGRDAADPTEPNRDGAARLSPRFVEWLMGLPAGWVTDLDIPRTQQLKVLGNGVVPQQARAAIGSLNDSLVPVVPVVPTKTGTRALSVAAVVPVCLTIPWGNRNTGTRAGKSPGPKKMTIIKKNSGNQGNDE